MYEREVIEKMFPGAELYMNSVIDGTFPSVVKLIGPDRCGQAVFAEYVSLNLGYDSLLQLSGYQFGVRTDRVIDTILIRNQAIYVAVAPKTFEIVVGALPALSNRMVFLQFNYETSFSCLEIRFAPMTKAQMKEVLQILPTTVVRFPIKPEIVDAIYEYTGGHLDTVLDFVYSISTRKGKDGLLSGLATRRRSYKVLYQDLINPDVPFNEFKEKLNSAVRSENIVDLHRYMKDMLARDLAAHPYDMSSTGIYKLLSTDFSFSAAGMIGGFLDIASVIRS